MFIPVKSGYTEHQRANQMGQKRKLTKGHQSGGESGRKGSSAPSP